MKLNFTFFLVYIISFQVANAQCNGHISLCSKKYNEVSIVMTHNAYNHRADFQLPNQNLNVAQQLADGVRGLMLDVHNVQGDIVMMHNLALLGNEPAEVSLQQIKDFLDANPQEIITIIIESHVDAADIESVLNNVNLLPYCHEQQMGMAWPTLQQMIDSGKRLVVFSEKNDGLASQPWYHYVWDYVVETPYSFNDIQDFNCTVNRGDIANELFLLNHWITDANLGIGDTASAKVVNAHPFLINRANQCMAAFNKLPNFIGVDFYELGDPFLAADMLNGLTTSNIEVLQENIDFRFYPNPIKEYGILDLMELPIESMSLRIYDATGKVILTNGQMKSKQVLLQRGNLLPGTYYFQILHSETRSSGHGKFLVL